MVQSFLIEDFHFDISISTNGTPFFEVGECDSGIYSTQKVGDFPALISGTGLQLSIDDPTTLHPALIVDCMATLPNINPTFSIPSALWTSMEFLRYKDPYNNVEMFFGTEDLRACSFRVHACITLSQSLVYITHDTTTNRLLLYVPISTAWRKMIL